MNERKQRPIPPINEVPTESVGEVGGRPGASSAMSKKVAEEMRRRLIIGDSPRLVSAVERAIRVAPTDMGVLITGENGTGKENLARIVHDNSRRKHKAFITVNCGALPEGTINSELFGHKKGAFTGADSDHIGFFEKADGGTIFLDEVADLPLPIQVLLLRVIEYGEFNRMGETTVRKTNVRIVAATNRDMPRAIADGRFREDLFYRLSTVQVSLPPLRERGEDIMRLVKHFVDTFVSGNNSQPPRFTPDAVAALEKYRWPGNVRELRNVIGELCVLEAGKTVTAERLRLSLPELQRPAALVPVEPAAQYDYNHDREVIFQIIMQLRGEIEELRAMVAGNGGEPAHVSTHLEELHRQPHRLTVSSLHEIADGRYADIAVDDYLADDTPQDLGHAAEVAHHETAHPLHAARAGVKPLDQMKRDSIEDALNEFAGNRRKAAEALGISERTLYRKIKQYGLE